MSHYAKRHPASGAFWLKPINLFGLFEFTTVTQIHMCSPYRLSNPSPGRGFQDTPRMSSTCFGALSR